MNKSEMVTRIAITGSNGLLGYHVKAAVHAFNRNLEFRNQPPAFKPVSLNRADFDNQDVLQQRLLDCDVVLHLAGINRAEEKELETGNQQIAKKLITALEATGNTPHVIFSNSIQSRLDNPYGIGKRMASKLIENWAADAGAAYTDVLLPHIFGEGGVPFYNTVTATLCHQLVHGMDPTIHSGAHVELVHAGQVADLMLQLLKNTGHSVRTVEGLPLPVEQLYQKLLEFKTEYDANIFPAFKSTFDVQLFNTYRAAEFPCSYPRVLRLNKDERGVLFEAAKGGGGGQTFLSWTEPGIERGNHFHRYKIERFLVLSGAAEIRIRALFNDKIHRYSVDGNDPMAIDMPTLHTHSIVNTGKNPLLTLFWAHEIFDPDNPDTYAEPVIQKS